MKKFLAGKEPTDRFTLRLLPFSPKVQTLLAEAVIRYKIPRSIDNRDAQNDFFIAYRAHAEKYQTVESLEPLADEIKGIKAVNINLAKLSRGEEGGGGDREGCQRAFETKEKARILGGLAPRKEEWRHRRCPAMLPSHCF